MNTTAQPEHGKEEEGWEEAKHSVTIHSHPPVLPPSQTLFPPQSENRNIASLAKVKGEDRTQKDFYKILG